MVVVTHDLPSAYEIADRIVVLMTRATGKVRAVAKGVRRTSSKFGSRLEPGSYVSVQLHEGRGELDIVTQAETERLLADPRSLRFVETFTDYWLALRKAGANFEVVSGDGLAWADLKAGQLAFNTALLDPAGIKILGAQGAAVADATGAGDIVAQFNTFLARARAHGLIAT